MKSLSRSSQLDESYTVLVMPQDAENDNELTLHDVLRFNMLRAIGHPELFESSSEAEREGDGKS